MELVVWATRNKAVWILRVLLVVILFGVGTVNLVSAAGLHVKGDPSGTRGARGSSSPKAEYAPGEVIVKFKKGVSGQQKTELHAKQGGKMLREWKPLRLQRVKLKEGDQVEDALARYRSDPAVEYAEPNYIMHAHSIPNDPMFSSLWGLQKIAASGAWDYSTGSQDVVVAVIDTGIDYNHLDLHANMWVNPREIAGNALDDDGNGVVDDIYGLNAITGSGNPFDDNGHGTHVAGTIGAAGNNSLGVAGVNWSVKMIACKFLDAGGSGSASDALDCLQYVRALKDQGVNIVATSNSWGGGGYSQAMYDAIAAQQDILFIAAAGNDSSDTDLSPHYPSNYDLPNVISVAATDSSDQLASFSNYGHYSVDIAAPGVSILSTLPATNAFGVTGGYGTLSGTSMATPHVTGLAALLKAQDPSRDAARIKNLILSGGDDVPALAQKSLTGKRINAQASLSAIKGAVLSLGWLPSHVTPGKSYPLSAFSVNGDAAAPVTVTGSDGTLLQLSDSGVAPDAHAGDSVFTGLWTPSTVPVTLTFTSSAGSKSVTLGDLAVAGYLADASQDVPYSQPLRVGGGTPPYTWAIITGTLPPGLTLDAGAGVISGTATIRGTYPFVAQVTDSTGISSQGTFNFIVDGLGWADQKWGGLYDNSGDERAFGAATDAAGNTYVAGEAFNGKDMDVIVGKYDPTGNLVWTRIYDGGSYDSGRSIAVDSTGSIYVAGVTGVPGNHLLLKYDPSGNLVWKKSWDRGGDDIAWGVTTGAGGAIYTVGTIDTADGSRVFLAKYDSAGNTLWTKVHQETPPSYVIPPWDDYGYSIAVDGGGNIYFGGTRIYSADGWRIANNLVAKYDAAGNLLWSKMDSAVNGGVSEVVQGVAVDDSGNVYVTGWVYSGEADRDGPIIEPLTSMKGMVMKLASTGSKLWGRELFTDTRELCHSIALSGGKVYLGCEESDFSTGDYIARMARYDSAGNLVWTRPLNPGGASSARGIAADSAGFSVAGFRDNGFDDDIMVARYAEAVPHNDLSVTSVSGTLLQYGTLNYSATVRNTGSGNPFARVNIYLSPSATPRWDDTFVDYRTNLQFPAGVDTVISGVVSVPPSITSGTYYVAAIADPYPFGAMNETDKSNNAAVGPLVTLTCDLAVTNVSTTVTNGALSYSVTVQNKGRNASAASTTAIEFSSGAGAKYAITSVSTPSIDAGKDTTLIGTAAVPTSIPPGTYAVAAVADVANITQDIDVSNNRGVGNSVTLPVDLTVSALSGTVSAGKLSYTAKLKNNGLQTASPALGLYFSPDASASADDYPVTLINVGSVTGGGEGTVTGTVDIPAGIPSGTYFLAALADPANAIAETDETNNGRVAGSFAIGTRRPSLNYSVTGTGSGAVNFVPGGSCAGSCSQSYDAGTSVTLTAVPASDSGFAGWTGACTGTSPCTVTVDADKAVTASFVKKPALSYTPLGAGTGTVNFEPGRSCTGACVQSFDLGTGVTLAAAAGTGSVFTGWTGACSGTGSCTVTTDRDKTVSATFQPIVPTVSVGGRHTLVKTGDTVWGWGDNTYGQLGDGTTKNRLSPVQLPNYPGVASIAIGRDSFTTMALHDDGTLWSSGCNSYGQVGDGSTNNRTTPAQISGLSQVVAAGGGSLFGAAVTGDGTVWTWGSNYTGQLGDGTRTSRSVPVRVPGLSNVVAIGGGEQHSFAVKGDGTVWGWGYNSYGLIGDGSTGALITTPVQVPALSGVVAVTGGESHSVVLKKDGTVWAWGYDYYGELGDGTLTLSRTTPAQVIGLTGVVAIAAGYHHTLALKSDGTVWAWGWNNYGQVGGINTSQATPVQVPGLTGIVAIAAGTYHSVAVGADGSIWTWGDNRYGQLGDGTLTNRSTPVRVTLDVTAPTTTASIAGGSYSAPQTVALAANEPATVYYTVDGSVPTTASAVYTAPITVSATGTLRFFAVDTAGNREAVKAESYLIGVSGVPNAEFTSSTSSGNLPLSVTFSDLSTGSPSSWLWDFGDNSTSTVQNPVHSYAAAGNYTVSLTVTNAAGSATRTRTGYISVQQPGLLPSITGLAAGSDFSGAVVDGMVATWGNNGYGQLGDPRTTRRSVPNVVPGLTPQSALSPGSSAWHMLTVNQDGSVSAWGRNYAGEVGDGTTTQRNTSFVVPGLPPISAVSTGYLDSMALGKDGTVWAWGSNIYGKLGDGTSTDRHSPVQVSALASIAAIAAGGQHSLALTTGGTVWTWGYNYNGQLGDGSTTTRSTPAQVPLLAGVVAIAAGYSHSVALRTDGTVWTWGGNLSGQIGDGSTTDRSTPLQVPGVSGVVAIAAGSSFTVALKGDGTVLAWGDNNYGQLGDGTTTKRTSPVQVGGLTGVTTIAAGSSHVLTLTQDGTLWAWGGNSSGQLGDGTTTNRSRPVRVSAIDAVAPATTAYPAGGSYTSPQGVTLAANESATIYYTVDGSTPTASSPVSSGPLSIGFSTTLKYLAKDPAGNTEVVNTQVYRIGATGVPTADFSGAATSGGAPLTVAFSDLSAGTPSSWLWNFGDGTTSTLKNPIHVYDAPGLYTVSLTVTNAAASDTRMMTNYISATDPGPSPLQPVYNGAVDGAVIRVRAGQLVEDPVLDRNITVKIGGGYDFLYRSTVGATIVHGKVRIKNGKVSLENLILQ